MTIKNVFNINPQISQITQITISVRWRLRNLPGLITRSLLREDRMYHSWIPRGLPRGSSLKSTYEESHSMKYKLFIVIAVAFFSAGNSIAAEDISPVLPSAFIAEAVYEFEPVADGTLIMHDYLIQNKGDGTLEIQKVNTG